MWKKIREALRRPLRREAINFAPLAVPDTEPWWIAIHAIIDEAEWETIEGARRRTGKTNECIAAIGAGEGVALVRQKLSDARKAALNETPRNVPHGN